jgi:hypothetical protein
MSCTDHAAFSDVDENLLNKIESPQSSFDSSERRAVAKCNQSDVTNKRNQSWSTMSLKQAEPSLIRDMSPHSTCSDNRMKRSFFTSLLSNGVKMSDNKLQYNSDGETRSRNFLSTEK